MSTVSDYIHYDGFKMSTINLTFTPSGSFYRAISKEMVDPESGKDSWTILLTLIKNTDALVYKKIMNKHTTYEPTHVLTTYGSYFYIKELPSLSIP